MVKCSLARSAGCCSALVQLLSVSRMKSNDRIYILTFSQASELLRDVTLGANMRVHLVRTIILSEPEVRGQKWRSIIDCVQILTQETSLIVRFSYGCCFDSDAREGAQFLFSTSLFVVLPPPARDPTVLQHHVFPQKCVWLGPEDQPPQRHRPAARWSPVVYHEASKLQVSDRSLTTYIMLY